MRREEGSISKKNRLKKPIVGRNVASKGKRQPPARRLKEMGGLYWNVTNMASKRRAGRTWKRDCE